MGLATVYGAAELRRALLTASQALGYVGNLAATFGWEQTPELRHVWSLAVEEQFYLVWPIAFLLLARHRRGLVVTVIVALVVASVLVRVHWYGDGNLAVVARTEARADSLLLGAVTACLFRWRTVPDRWAGPILSVGLISFGALLVLPQDLGWYAQGGYTVVAVTSALCVLGAAMDTGPITAALAWRPLRRLGRVSYGVYLWHVVVAYVVARHTGPLPAEGKLLLATVLTLVVVLVSWRWVETPWLRRKDVMTPKQADLEIGVVNAGRTDGPAALLSTSSPKDRSEAASL